MSGAEKQKENAMLARLIELEEQKLRAAAAPGLSPQSVASVMNRLRAEKDAILAEHDRTPELVAKRGGLVRFAAPLGLAAAALIAVGVYFFTLRQPTPAATLAFASGAVTIAQAPGVVGQKIAAATPLATADKSFAELRIDSFARIVVAPQAELSVLHLARNEQKPDIAIRNLRGTVFADIDTASSRFVVQTQTATVTVTGTSFAVTASETGTTVQVLDGTVTTQLSAAYLEQISAPAAREKLKGAFAVAAKQKLLLNTKTQSVELSELSDAEVSVLNSYRQLVRASGDNEVRTKLTREIVEHEAKPQAAITPARMTLADIRVKYGKVSLVNLVNGKSYTGFFKMRGAQIEVITPAGSVKLATADLKDVQDLP